MLNAGDPETILCSAQTGAGNGTRQPCVQYNITVRAPDRGEGMQLPPLTCEEEGRRVITLYLKELVMLWGMKAGLGRRTAKLPSPWILRHEGATEREARSLTHLAAVSAKSRRRKLQGLEGSLGQGA